MCILYNVSTFHQKTVEEGWIKYIVNSIQNVAVRARVTVECKLGQNKMNGFWETEGKKKLPTQTHMYGIKRYASP
jgi:hypothetical protein